MYLLHTHWGYFGGLGILSLKSKCLTKRATEDSQTVSRFLRAKIRATVFLLVHIGVSTLRRSIDVCSQSFFYGILENIFSLRSKGNFKVNEIANKYFSGGGHMNASGGISEVSVNDTIKIVEKIISDNKTELNNQNN